MVSNAAKMFLVGLLSITGSAIADSTTVCTQGNEQRSVSVVQQNLGSQVPCEVQYTKNSGTQTLWKYQHEAGQCEIHASEFVAKLQGWGFACSEQGMQNPGAIEGETPPAQ